jgi:formylglycine-generating enzyme required for sulfatase activity
MGWDSGERAKLNALRHEGVKVVRYKVNGCDIELEVLSQCIAKGEYQYVPYASTSKETLDNEDELWSELPLGAAKLSGKLRQKGAIRRDYQLVGTSSLRPDWVVDAGSLSGPACAGATHVVSRFYLGGFSVVSGRKDVLEAEARLFGIGAGGGGEHRMETEDGDGNPAWCEKALSTGEEQPLCSAPVRIELVPIEDAGQVAAPIAAAPLPQATAPSSADMLRIPAGTFVMGSSDGDPDEKPPHHVTVSAFEMDKTEVTVLDYEACVRAGVCAATDTGGSCNYGKSDRGNHPINCVGKIEAETYCGWVGKRLPTEEEWEYAARGTDGRTYPWGNQPPEGKLCWNRTDGTCPVGSFASWSSPFGLLDMAGNVWEWTSSGFSSDYQSNRETDRFVIRGGSWFTDLPSNVRTAYRDRYVPGNRLGHFGFRCAR